MVQLIKNTIIRTSIPQKRIHPLALKIATNLSKIDIIKDVKITQDQLYASSETTTGYVKTPITKPDHPTAVGICLLFDFSHKSVDFFEINSPKPGYGTKMVDAVLRDFPDDWTAAVVFDWSGGFWTKMQEVYSNNNWYYF
jgi:hypothetical protein